MKYIRNEFGIEQMSKDELQKRFYGNIDDIIKKGGDEAHKIADTIEELCDEFVGVSNYLGKYIIHTHFNSLHEIERFDYKQDIIYGAIWTSKGLIYVAKMNQEGDLILL